ncbi:unnamed protein product, partial [marine sediment metagenome]
VGVFAAENTPKDEQVEVKVVGLQVRKKVPNFKDTYTSTSVWLRFRLQNKIFVNLQPYASKILTFTDDKGTNLKKAWQADRPAFFPGDFPGARERYISLSRDSKECILHTHFGTVPADDAKQLHLEANLIFFVAQGEKKAIRKDVPLKNGETIVAGPVKMVIKDVKTSGSKKEGKTTMTLVTQAGADVATSVRFITPDGKEIDYHVPSATTTRDNQGRLTKIERNYLLRRKL